MVKKDNSETIKENKSKGGKTLELKTNRDIAMDFAVKVSEKFDKIVKSVVLFGSSVKDNLAAGSDVDIMIIVDDATIKWDMELTAWYREELGRLIQQNPYKKELHINTARLTTWWLDIQKGDPVVMNVLRFGEAMIDFGGFFNPQKILLEQGKIRSTPEAVYTALQRAPFHLSRSRVSILSAIEGIYWCMVDTAQAMLITAQQIPPSPEHIPIMLKETFVDKGRLDMKYVTDFRDLYVLHRKIIHGDLTHIKGEEIDAWRDKAEAFLQKATEIIKEIVE